MGHNENWKAFGSSFFRDHQNKLLWLLNNPIFGYWFRYVLRINGRRSDLGRNKVWKIHPNSVFWREGEKTVAEFRTHPKFAKRLYYAFRPFWDLVLAFRVLPYEQDGYLFGKSGFVRRQPLLLYLLNGSLKHWFRWVLRINGDRSSVGNREIIQILPHAIWWREGKEYHAEFRTHNKFSKRVYFAFRPLWEAMHFWDWLIADRFAPSLSFGFNNYVAYPDPDPETTTVDGDASSSYSSGSGVSWATIRSDTGNESDSNSAIHDAVWIRGDTVSNQWTKLRRGIFLFDTSPLGSTASISTATLSLYGTSKFDNLSCTPNVDIYTCSPASNTSLASSDYSTFGSTSQTGSSPISYSSWSTSAYNNFSLSATGIGNISKTSVSKFGTRNANYDVSGTTPNWVSGQGSILDCYFADQTGTANDPKLVVAYILASGAAITVYPDADPETTTVDGTCGTEFIGMVSWATLVASAGDAGWSSELYDDAVYIRSGTTTDTWDRLFRGIFMFDTSPLTSSATISSATMSLYGYTNKTDALGITPNIDIYTSAPASNTDVVAGDFDSVGTTSQTGSPISYASWSTSAFNNFSLSATGIGNISKTGVTKFATRNANYDASGTPPSWSSLQVSRLSTYLADQTGTTNDPKLVVNFTFNRNPGAGSLGVSGAASRMDLGIGVPSTIWEG